MNKSIKSDKVIELLIMDKGKYNSPSKTGASFTKTDAPNGSSAKPDCGIAVAKEPQQNPWPYMANYSLLINPKTGKVVTSADIIADPLVAFK